MLRKYAPSFIQRLDGSRLAPGAFVTHVEDQAARGTLVALAEEAVVLWANPPWMETIEVQSQPILAKSRKLNARWSAEVAEDLKTYHGIDVDDPSIVDIKCTANIDGSVEYEVEREEDHGINMFDQNFNGRVQRDVRRTSRTYRR